MLMSKYTIKIIILFGFSAILLFTFSIFAIEIHQPPVVEKKLTLSLMSAIEKNDLFGVQKAITEGVDTNVISSDGRTPLTLAANNGNEKIVDYLVKHGANVNLNDKKFEQTALQLTSNLNVAKFLVTHGADINAVSKNGWYPVVTASGEGHFDILKYLVKSGATLNTKNPGTGLNPLMAAN